MQHGAAAVPTAPYYPDPDAPLPRGARFSFAQNWEDAYLHRLFGDMETGFYVDVGAWDPTSDSVTRIFYDRGWTGINVEPGRMFETLAAARPRDVNLPVAVAAEAGRRRFLDLSDTRGLPAGTSHFRDLELQEDDDGAQGREVEVRPLADVLSEHAADREIHFLKIDVEGAEREVLVSNDWTRFRPWVVVVEATYPGTPETCHELWEDVLVDAGYSRAFFDGLNMYYCRADMPELAAMLDRPINVFDGFRQFDSEVAATHRAFAETARRIPALVAERDAAIGERDAAGVERDALRAERDDLEAGRSALSAERDDLIAACAELHASLEAAVAERQGIAADRDAVATERDRLSAERDALVAERDRERERARQAQEGATARLLRLQTRYRIDGATRELRLGLWLARRLRQADRALARLVGRKHLALRPMKARFLATTPAAQQAALPGPAATANVLSTEPMPSVGPKLEAVIAEIRAAEARTAARERATAEGLEAVLLALAARASKH